MSLKPADAPTPPSSDTHRTSAHLHAMATRYAPDDIVTVLQNSKSNAAHYVFRHEEAKEQFPVVVMELESTLVALLGLHPFRGTLLYATAISDSPFQITRPSRDCFVVIVAPRAVDMLRTLCLRIQSLPPLAQYLNVRAIRNNRDYSGKFLLDITKDISFHTTDITALVAERPNLDVFTSALLHIVSHEVAHAAHGHLELRDSVEFEEFSTSDDDLALTMRAFEMDADCFAATSVFGVWEHLLKQQIVARRANGDPVLESAAVESRRRHATGLLLAHIFSDTLTLNFWPNEHPIGYARFLTSMGVLTAMLERDLPNLVDMPEHVREQTVECFARLAGGIHFLGHPIASNILIYDGPDKEIAHVYDSLGVLAGLAHLEPLHRRWSRLRPVLEPLVRGGVLAPALGEQT